jgi:hypothetical protein
VKKGEPDVWRFIRDQFGDTPYGKYLLSGVLPPPVDASGGLQLSLEQWMMLSQEPYNVPTCFHTLEEGDVYYIRRGTLHFFVNQGYSTSLTADVLYDWETHPLGAYLGNTNIN